MNTLPSLPKDLMEAENDFSKIILEHISNIDNNRLSINIKFEGLKLMPILLRLGDRLNENHIKFKLLWSDAGSAALAKRDNPELIEYIYSFGEIIAGKSVTTEEELLIAVSPQPYDYDQFLQLCNSHTGKIIMFNGRLEDTAVGIGSIGRDRRKSFLSSWKLIYSLEPISQGALMINYPEDWHLFRLDEDGYRYLQSFPNRPDIDTIAEFLIA
tara:strand:- start:2528 stop:3166 length:639 start_codon:yes stop_codon:yes gene_type:complete